MALRPSDMTVLYLVRTHPANGSSEVMAVVQSPHLPPYSETLDVDRDALSAWLRRHYASFAQHATRGMKRIGPKAPSASDVAVPMMRGFGVDLYRRFAPGVFKKAFWQLKDKLGPRFRTIQIVTNDPLLPWELMRPRRDDGADEQDFLGVSYAVGRWHVSEGRRQLERPPQLFKVEEVAVMAPRYKGTRRLPTQADEIRALSLMKGFRIVRGNLSSLKALLSDPPPGVIHFAGHGKANSLSEGLCEYSIALEDSEVSLPMWKGMEGPPSGDHPFFFLNACDVGQAQKVAGFVEGWAPAALDAGASGYVGGLWPLSDRGASDFAKRFYRKVESKARKGPVCVAEALKETRRAFRDTGDPTYLAYVYYGDPHLCWTVFGR